MDFLSRLFDPSGFVPRRDCGDWTEGLVLLHNASDTLIWLAYLAIPLVLIYFVRRRQDTPFPWIFWLFGAFIVSCGFTHFLEVVMFYNPLYRLAGLLKAATALVSLATVVALVQVVPRALSLRSPEELEREVTARTAELARANTLLHREVAERLRAEQTLREERERFRLTLASIGDGVVSTDRLGRVAFCNAVACALTGWGPDEALGKPLEEVFRVIDEGTRQPIAAPASFDADAALGHAGGDESLFREVIVLFRETGPALLADIQNGLELGDAQQVQRAAHSLRGSAGFFAAPAVTDPALRLEQMGAEGNLTAGAEVLALLTEGMDRLLADLAGLERQELS